MPKNKRHKKKPLLTKLEVAVLVLTLADKLIDLVAKLLDFVKEQMK